MLGRKQQTVRLPGYSTRQDRQDRQDRVGKKKRSAGKKRRNLRGLDGAGSDAMVGLVLGTAFIVWAAMGFKGL